MARYRKKPVVIEAMELTKDTVVEVLDFVGEAAQSLTQTFDDGMVIGTLEGNHLASWGDFVIKGVNGEFYPCKPDIFWKTYERAE